eukprot:766248-Hanusia_phi.AAC.1
MGQATWFDPPSCKAREKLRYGLILHLTWQLLSRNKSINKRRQEEARKLNTRARGRERMEEGGETNQSKLEGEK